MIADTQIAILERSQCRNVCNSPIRSSDTGALRIASDNNSTHITASYAAQMQPNHHIHFP